MKQMLEEKMAIEGLRNLRTIYAKKDNSQGMWTVTLELLDFAIKAIEENKELKLSLQARKLEIKMFGQQAEKENN